MIRFLFVFIFSSFVSFAQVKDTITIKNISAELFKEWQIIEKDWIKNEFSPFLKRNKIYLSCAKTTKAYIDVVFNVLEDGHIHAKIVHNVKGGSQFNAKQLASLEKSLYRITFSSAWTNSICKMRMGLILKC